MAAHRRNVSTLTVAFAAALTLAGLATTARAQVAAEPAPTRPTGPEQPVYMPPAAPAPTIPDMMERNGNVNRFIPIESHLPPDPRRDNWYDTRWGDPPNRMTGSHPNFYRNGGLYGIPWKATHTASIYPYFFGSPGENTLNADVKRVGYLQRLPRMLFHPFKPIGMYYEQGSYVPVYDLDPLVPGPTAWPYPFYRRLTNWGG